MLIKAILLGLVSLVAVVDSRLIGRQNIGRPLILSTLAGLVLGDKIGRASCRERV